VRIGTRTLAANLREIVRFAIVGGASTLLYVALTVVLTRADIPLAEASLVSYVACGLVSFLGHRAFTFASRGSWAVEAARFAALNFAGVIASSAAPIVFTDRLGLPPIYAIAVTCAVAPAVNYLAMRALVFHRIRRAALAAQ